MPEEARYHARLRDGLCVGCGRASPLDGRVRCRKCLLAVREATAGRAADLIRRGRCRTCGQRQAKAGHRDCAACLRRYADYTRQRSGR